MTSTAPLISPCLAALQQELVAGKTSALPQLLAISDNRGNSSYRSYPR